MSGARPLAAILAGGRSRRFGSPKALAVVAGAPLVTRVRDALLGVVPDPVLVTDRPELFAGLGLPARPDAVPDHGPLAGLLTALRWARELGRPGALVVACDLPFLDPALLRRIVEEGLACQAPALVPESPSRRGVEPLCAWYATTALPLVEARLRAGERALAPLLDALPAARLPLGEVARYGDPRVLFLNVNTPADHARALHLTAEPGRMTQTTELPVVSVIGKKNSGKTTLVVALAAELKRRGHRIATVKHGHPHFELDQPGRDSWRHFHEGEAEAVLLVSSEKIALVARVDAEPDPRALIARHLGGIGYDLVLVEGYKHGPFPKIEVFRRAVHERPILDPTDPAAAAQRVALVTDTPGIEALGPVVPLDPEGAHVSALAGLIEERFLSGGRDAT